MDKEELSNKIEQKCHDGPFGPVEFGCTISESSDELVLSIYHMKVHEEYQGHGYGKRTLGRAVQIASDNGVEKVEVTIGGGMDTREFLKRAGFKDVKVGSDESVRASQSTKEIHSVLNGSN